MTQNGYVTMREARAMMIKAGFSRSLIWWRQSVNKGLIQSILKEELGGRKTRLIPLEELGRILQKHTKPKEKVIVHEL